jgi:GNAT superfamily N-acetyltransferase
MNQPALATGQAVADLAQRVGTAELAEQHRDELGPAGKALRGSLGVVPLYQSREFGARKMLQQLIEQARDRYHDLALLGNVCGEIPAKRDIRSRLIIGGLRFAERFRGIYFGQECF